MYRPSKKYPSRDNVPLMNGKTKAHHKIHPSSSGELYEVYVHKVFTEYVNGGQPQQFTS
jgi:hypothetical protein